MEKLVEKLKLFVTSIFYMSLLHLTRYKSLLGIIEGLKTYQNKKTWKV